MAIFNSYVNVYQRVNYRCFPPTFHLAPGSTGTDLYGALFLEPGGAEPDGTGLPRPVPEAKDVVGVDAKGLDGEPENPITSRNDWEYVWEYIMYIYIYIMYILYIYITILYIHIPMKHWNWLGHPLEIYDVMTYDVISRYDMFEFRWLSPVPSRLEMDSIIFNTPFLDVFGVVFKKQKDAPYI